MASASEETETPFNVKDIQCFFSKNEWKELSSYDKINLFNKKRNYERMLAAGLTPKKPDFMASEEERAARAAIELKRQLQSQADRLKKREAAVSLAPSRRSIRCNTGELREIMMKIDGDGSNTLFCDECDKTWIGECIQHGKLPIYPIPIRKLDRQKPNLALPYKLEWVDPGNLAAGVRASISMSNRLLLGPYQGDVDVESPATWMAFVKSSDRATANLRPLFYQGGLYFRTVATIRVGDELLLGPAAAVEADASCGPCETCGRSFIAAPFLQQHWRAAPACAAAFEQSRRAARVAAEEQRRAALAAAEEQRRAALAAALAAAEEQRRAALVAAEEQRRAALAAAEEQREMERRRRQQEKQRRRDEVDAAQERARQRRAAAALEEEQHRLEEQHRRRRQQEDLYRLEVEIAGASKDGDVYRCEHCGASFRRASLFRAHLKKAHGLSVSADSAKGVSCLSCGANFPTGDQLHNHILQTHLALKHFVCRKCDKVFSGMEELEAHTKLSSCVGAAQAEADRGADDIPAKRGRGRPKRVRFQLP